MFDIVLFDLDGTLTDPYEGVTNGIRYALQSVGLDETDPVKLRSYIGPPLRVTFAGYGFSPEQCEKLVAKYRELYLVTGIHQNYLYPGIELVLKNLSEHGIKLGLASCKPEDACLRVLDEHGVLGYFSQIVGATVDKTMDTKPAIIAEVLRRFGISPEDRSRVLMVGDRGSDIDGAHENSVVAAGVLYGYGEKEELLASGADFLVEKPEEILNFVKK